MKILFILTFLFFSNHAFCSELEIRSELLKLSQKDNFTTISASEALNVLQDSFNKADYNLMEKSFIYDFLTVKTENDSAFGPLLSQFQCYSQELIPNENCSPLKKDAFKDIPFLVSSPTTSNPEKKESFFTQKNIYLTALAMVVGIGVYNWSKDKELILELPF